LIKLLVAVERLPPTLWTATSNFINAVTSNFINAVKRQINLGLSDTVLWEMLIEATFNQTNFWLIFFSILWHKVWVLIYNMFIFEKVGHSKFVERHGDTSDFFSIRFQIGSVFFFINCDLFIELSTLIPLQLENRLWTTVVLFYCCNLYLLQFMTVSVNIRSCYICIP
jgi:hypothetical protein